MFKAFPYIDIHPLNTIQDPIDCKKVLICDESFKTGFTYSIYEAYLQRVLPRSPKFSVQTLFKHINSENVETLNPPIVASLFCVEEDNHIKINENIRQVYDFDIKIKSDWDCLKKDFIKYTNMNGSVDLTCVISSTPLAWAAAQHFAEQIISECGIQPVFIFSPSPEGRVLELLTSFLLKLKNISVSFRKESINESFNVLIDLTCVTGFTALSHWELFQDIRKSDSKRLESDFNLIDQRQLFFPGNDN